MGFGISNVATNAGEVSQTGQSKIDQTKSQFLQLLLAQLQNQDPLSPADTDQMTAQMMQLGQLEQLFDMNESMNSLVDIQSSSLITNYGSMVGKNVFAKGSAFEIADVEKGQISFSIPQTPDNTTIRVFDRFGNLKREMPYEVSGPGFHQVSFDGLGNDGQPLDNGFYRFTIEATDKNGNGITVQPYSHGKISSIRIENGRPIFQFGDSDLGLADIERIF